MAEDNDRLVTLEIQSVQRMRAVLTDRNGREYEVDDIAAQIGRIENMLNKICAAMRIPPD